MKRTIKRKQRLASVNTYQKQWLVVEDRVSGFEPDAIEARIRENLTRQSRRKLNRAFDETHRPS